MLQQLLINLQNLWKHLAASRWGAANQEPRGLARSPWCGIRAEKLPCRTCPKHLSQKSHTDCREQRDPNTHDSRGFAVECTYHWTTVGIVWEAQPHSLEIRYMLPMVFECWKSTYQTQTRTTLDGFYRLEFRPFKIKDHSHFSSSSHTSITICGPVVELFLPVQLSFWQRKLRCVCHGSSKKLLEQESHGSCMDPRKIHLNQILVVSYGHTVCQGLLLISICSYTYYIDMQMTMRYYYRYQIRKYLKKTPISINWCMHNSQFGQFSHRGS